MKHISSSIAIIKVASLVLNSSCAAAIAQMHEIPLVLLHNTGFPQPTSNLARFQLSFVPNIVYQIFPEFAVRLLHEAYVVMFKNFPDIRMAISVGNKCNMDLKTNASYSSLLHFWASYPRLLALIAHACAFLILLLYNRYKKWLELICILKDAIL